jgi:HK97 family phage prohead protease
MQKTTTQMSSRAGWSVKTVNTKKGSYGLVTGTAYPRVLPGKNATKRLKPNAMKNRQAFYHDPAVKLSQADMDGIDGAEGAPLCFEHNKGDVVGLVSQSWLGDDDNQLRIVARIPLDNERGKKIWSDIQAGDISGFSVGYRTEFDDEQDDVVASKTFHEISLVKKPFFDGCNISRAIMASADEKGI